MFFNAKLLVVLALRAATGSSLQVQSGASAFYLDPFCGRDTTTGVLDMTKELTTATGCENAATSLGLWSGISGTVVVALAPLLYCSADDTLPRGCLEISGGVCWNEGVNWIPDPWDLKRFTSLVCKSVVAEPSATGDPHMKNIRGEIFEIRKPGVHTFLTMPQNSNAESALLRVDALVLGDDCSALFIKRINIAGKWLGDVPPLAFSVDGAGEGQLEGPGLRLGNSSFLTMEEFMSRVPRDMFKMDLPQKAIETPTLANTHATTMAATVKFTSGVYLKISWVTERTQASHVVKSLWVTSKGLSSVNMPIGGLLGTDEHSLVSKPCHNMSSEMRMSSGYIVASAEH